MKWVAEQAFKFRLLLEQTLCRWPKELVMATVAVTPLKTNAGRRGEGFLLLLLWSGMQFFAS